MKNLIIICTSLLLFVSCTKEPQKHSIRYEADNAVSMLSIAYMNEEGDLIEISQNFNSAEDSWSYEQFFDEGQIVYVSSIYAEEGGSQRLRILIDGKAWRQGQNELLPGEQGRITLSGTIPID